MPAKKQKPYKFPKIKANKRKAWNGTRCYAKMRSDNKTGVATQEYRDGWDRIFGKKLS